MSTAARPNLSMRGWVKSAGGRLARASVGHQPFGAHPVELPALGRHVLLRLAYEFLESWVLAHRCDVGRKFEVHMPVRKWISTGVCVSL